MKRRTVRFAFALATLLVATALVLHIVNWSRTGVINWASAANMLGLLVLTTTGLADPPAGRVRTAFTILALVLIVPSAALMIMQAFLR